MYWSIAVIVLSNVVYNICSKATLKEISPFASLTVYILGMITFGTNVFCDQQRRKYSA